MGDVHPSNSMTTQFRRTSVPASIFNKALAELDLNHLQTNNDKNSSCITPEMMENISTVLDMTGGLLRCSGVTRQAAVLEAMTRYQQCALCHPLPATMGAWPNDSSPWPLHTLRVLISLQAWGKIIPCPDTCKTTSHFTASFAELCQAHHARIQYHAGNRRKFSTYINEGIHGFHAEARGAWRKARAKAQHERLAALKADDIEAYMHLIHTANSDKIQHLLAATDACLRHLTDRLQLSSVISGEVVPSEPACADNTCSNADDVAPGATEAKKGADHEASKGPLASLKESTEVWNLLAGGHGVEINKQPAMLTGGQLRGYQLQGLRWMASLRRAGVNGILADEMGLGKTVQVIALVAHLLEETSHQEGNESALLKPVLIAAPASVLPNWEREFQVWAPEIQVIVYRGNALEREAVFLKRMRKAKPPRKTFQVALTTYESLMGKADRPRLSSIYWEYIVIDEGHRLKNAGCKLNGELRAYKADHRLLITGTPLQNNLEELWSLLNFLMPGTFDSSDDFKVWFGGTMESPGPRSVNDCHGPSDDVDSDDDAVHAALLNEEEVLIVTNRLHQVLRPFILRRLKDAVVADLPAKVEHVIRCRPSAYQSALFSAVEEHLSRKGGVRGVSNVLMELRCISNHPLISRLHPDGAEDSLPRHPMPAEIRLCGKLEVLDRLLLKLKAAGHRVLIFCTMTRLLDVLENYLEWRGLSYLRLDGSTKSSDRGALVAEFNAPNSSAFTFLLSVRAGGVGLNLQSADTVIFYDTDWNPQMDAQAAARVHRLGQSRAVHVLRLVTEGSVEERVVAVAAEKRGVAEMSITAGFFDGKTGVAERQRFLLDLLREEEGRRNATRGGSGCGILTDADMNRILIRGEEELAVFESVDRRLMEAESRAWEALPGGCDTQNMCYSRLAGDEEVRPLVDEVLRALEPEDPDAGQEFGRGKRARTAGSGVQY